MRPFLQALFGSFIGKLLAVLVIAICTTLGFAPDQWAILVIGRVPIWLATARIAFLFLGAITLILLLWRMFKQAPSPASGVRVGIHQRSLVERILKFGRAAAVIIGYCRFGLASIAGRVLRWFFYFVPQLNYAVPDSMPSRHVRDFNQMRHSLVWFYERFADAFPGIRRATEYTERRQIARRLNILLRDPLFAGDSQGAQSCPIRWTRGQTDMYLTRWYHLKPGVFLMNVDELAISKIIAIPGNVYWQSLVYVECSAQLPTGVYPIAEEDIANCIKHHHYADEEYAIYNFRKYTRAQYDDDGYERGGRIRRFRHRPDLRVRCLSSYNFLIAPQASPVRDRDVESALHDFLNACLDGTKSPQEFVAWLLTLPRSHELERFEYRD